jgi:hypothetical protein
MAKSMKISTKALMPILSLFWGHQIQAQVPITADEVAGFPAIFKAPSRKELPGDTELRKLLISRYNAALKVAIPSWVGCNRSRPNALDKLLATARRLIKVGMELNETPAEKLQFLKELVEFSSKLEPVVRNRVKVDEVELAALLEFRLEVETERVRIEKVTKGNGPKKGN